MTHGEVLCTGAGQLHPSQRWTVFPIRTPLPSWQALHGAVPFFPEALPLLLTTPLGTRARQQMVRPQSMSNASLTCLKGSGAIRQRVGFMFYRCWNWYATGFRWGSRFIPSYVTRDDDLHTLASAFLVILGCLAVILGLRGMILQVPAN